MKQRIIALRYLLSAIAVSAALSLVCFAQQASGSAVPPAVKTASADPAATLTRLCTALGIPAPDAGEVKPGVAKLADETSLDWMRRYRRDIEHSAALPS